MSTDESERPDDVCGFTLQPEDIGEEIEANSIIDDLTDWYERRGISSCIREPWQNHDYCIWHAEVEDKPAVVLATARADEPEYLDGAFLVDSVLKTRFFIAECRLWGADFTGTNLRNADLSGANLQDADLSGTSLRVADLSGADLRRADLSGASLWDADLSGANFGLADLSGADLGLADLSDAFLSQANLSDARLSQANLSGANLRDADLSGANLQYADLSDADLRNTTLVEVTLGNTDLSTVQLDHRTRFTPQSFRLWVRSIFGPRLGKIGLDSNAWNEHAIDAHRLAKTCSEQGLTRQARRLTIWDRHARRNVALSSGNLLTAFGSWLNWQATGYGVSVGRVSRNMLFLFLASTLTYLLYGIQTAEEAIPISDLVSRSFPTESVVNAVYFSVVTFTTSPPWTVSVGVSQWVAMVETFLGTLLVVLLGYVLGNREQI